MSFYCYFIFIYKIYVPNLGRLLVFILVECGDPLQVTLKSMYRRLIMIFHFGKSKSLLSISSSPVHQQTIVPMAEQYCGHVMSPLLVLVLQCFQVVGVQYPGNTWKFPGTKRV